MRQLHILAAILVVLAAPRALWAQDKLKPGDAAPVVDIDQWVSGPAAALTPGRLTVLLFWSSTSSKTLACFGALSEIQKSLASQDVVVMAISQEDDDVVRKFVGRYKERVNFSIGTDKGGRTAAAWADRTERKDPDSPTAFIVGRDGRVMYIGTPLEEKFVEVLNRVGRGRFDPKQENEGGPKLEAARRARKIKNWKLSLKMYDEVLALDRKVFADVAIEKFDQMLIDMDDPKMAYAYADMLLEEYGADPQFLSDFATKVATDPKIPDASRRLDVALKAAAAGVDIVRESDKSQALATLAMVYSQKQDLAKAVELQREAWFRAAPAHKPMYKRVLDAYQESLQRAEAKQAH